MDKPRLLIIGGKPFNVPPALRDHFEVAKHIEQDQAKFSLCQADYILVITNWVNHSAISSARSSMPKTPVIWVRKGWPAMRAEFIRRGLITAEPVPEQEPQSVNEQVEEAATVIGTSEEDAFASMSDEELEVATRPNQATAGNGAEAAAQSEPKKSEAELHAIWKEYLSKYVNDSLHIHYSGLDKSKVTEFLSLALNEEITREDLKAEFGVNDEVASAVFVGFTKSRGQFRTRYDLPPIHTKPKMRAPRTFAPPPPPPVPSVPAPIPSEVDRMLQEYMRLTQEKSKLIEEQHAVEAKIEAVNKQLEIMKPFAEHFKGLAAAAKKVREALEQQQTKKI